VQISSPKVSVLLTVYNGEEYLEKAVTSILRQTWTDFELICVDDGSTDRSKEFLQNFEAQDKRVQLLSRPNTGQVGALNDGLAIARGEFVARMDADDLSSPTRLEEQVRFLHSHPEIVCVGSCATVIDLDDDPINVLRVPLSHEEIEARHVTQGLGGGILHPVATMRTSVVRKLGGYRAEYQPAEDLDLWLRMAEVGRLANLETLLLSYRLNPAGLSYTNRAKQNQRANAAVNAARQRRGLTSLPPANNAWDPSPLSLLREAVLTSRREGFWPSAQKYAWRLVWKQPAARLGWRVLAESTFRQLFK
jgi:glycosyltransferase involved in cell wall biosynthesis